MKKILFLSFMIIATSVPSSANQSPVMRPTGGQFGCMVTPFLLSMYASLLYPVWQLADHLDNSQRNPQPTAFKQLRTPVTRIVTAPIPLALTIASFTAHSKNHWLKYLPGTLWTSLAGAGTAYVAKHAYDAYRNDDVLKFDTYFAASALGLGVTAFFAYGTYLESLVEFRQGVPGLVLR